MRFTHANLFAQMIARHPTGRLRQGGGGGGGGRGAGAAPVAAAAARRQPAWHNLPITAEATAMAARFEPDDFVDVRAPNGKWHAATV